MANRTTPYRPYLVRHERPEGAGDGRPTASEIISDCKARGSLRGRNVVITGCSGGIGKATAAAMYETGAQLFLTARDMAKLEQVTEEITLNSASKDHAYPRPILVEMRLDSLSSVRAAANEIRQKADSLQIMINNAGVAGVPKGTTEDDFEIHMGVNHLAHFLFFHLLQPLLAKGAQESAQVARVINVSSSSHMFSPIRFEDMHWRETPYKKMQAYGQSKTANIYMTNSLTRRFASQNLIGLAVHPGAIFEGSDLGRHFVAEDFADMPSLESLMPIFKSPGQGAATTTWAAVSPYFEGGGKGGRCLADVGETLPARAGEFEEGPGYARYAFDEEKEERLWRLSEEAVGISI